MSFEGGPIPPEEALRQIASGCNSVLFSQTGVQSTVTALPATPMPGRKWLYIYNAGGTEIYIGDASVTSSVGWRISHSTTQGFFLRFPISDTALVYAINTGIADVPVQTIELA